LPGRRRRGPAALIKAQPGPESSAGPQQGRRRGQVAGRRSGRPPARVSVTGQRIQVLESARPWPRSRRSTSFRTKNSMTGCRLPRPGLSRRAECRLARPYGLGTALGLAWNSGGRLPAAWVELWLAFNKYGQRLRKDSLLSLRLARKAASEAPPTPGGGPVATRAARRSQ